METKAHPSIRTCALPRDYSAILRKNLWAFTLEHHNNYYEDRFFTRLLAQPGSLMVLILCREKDWPKMKRKQHKKDPNLPFCRAFRRLSERCSDLKIKVSCFTEFALDKKVGNWLFVMFFNFALNYFDENPVKILYENNFFL